MAKGIVRINVGKEKSSILNQFKMNVRGYVAQSITGTYSTGHIRPDVQGKGRGAPGGLTNKLHSVAHNAGGRSSDKLWQDYLKVKRSYVREAQTAQERGERNLIGRREHAALFEAVVAVLDSGSVITLGRSGNQFGIQYGFKHRHAAALCSKGAARSITIDTIKGRNGEEVMFTLMRLGFFRGGISEYFPLPPRTGSGTSGTTSQFLQSMATAWRKEILRFFPRDVGGTIGTGPRAGEPGQMQFTLGGGG